MPKRRSFIDWYDRLISSFSIDDLFIRKRPPGPPRTIFINEPLPDEYYDKKHRVLKDRLYNSNQVITSKYTLFTFLPRNLLEQFRRVANVFFALIAFLQFFPKFSTISPGLVLFPLLVVLSMTAIKDGYEDIKRHESDRRVNSSEIRVLEGPGYVNHNQMVQKSKTFVRALTKRIGKGKWSVARTEISQALVAPTPPDVLEKSATVVSNDSAAVEYDDDLMEESRPHWNRSTWEDLRVGDFVKIVDHESIPADILICATSEDENVAFVETKNLDGETNLKSLDAQLAATVVIDGTRHPVDLQTTLLRGTVLRNTGWVIGIVVYTGLDTKLVLNSGGTPSKRGKVERQMNPMVMANLAILLAMGVACAIIDSLLEHHFFPKQAPWLFDDNRSGDNPSVNGVITSFGPSLRTFQNIVPISLYISIEAVRHLYYLKTDSPALARTFNLADDLGQIEYIFSDKTGTLTQNVMAFRRASVGGMTYVDEEPDINAPQEKPNPAEAEPVRPSGEQVVHFRSLRLLNEIEAAAADPRSPDRDRLGHFWTTLALCHTVLAANNPKTGVLEFKSQSPDEAALVQAAADVGFEFLGRDRDVLSLRTPFAPEPLRFRLLNILEFSSVRKRMSVIVRQLGAEDEPETSPVLLLCKGADNVIFERLAPGGEELKAVTEEQLDSFAREGLRTLTIAHRVVPEDEYVSWVERYQNALVNFENRDDEVEQNLMLLGATAIEDKLQDGVPEAIADLKDAGIKVWVLTGDKLETAIAVHNLIGRDANIIIIRGDESGTPIYTQMARATAEGQCGALAARDEESAPHGAQLYPLHRINTGLTSLVGSQNGQRPGGYVLVIDGLALTDALSDDRHKNALLRLSLLCEAVKALVVKLVKDGRDTVTLAIGDGANDVSMIQQADVGVGISGEEGLQAVNSSDFAIAQFRFLKRLLLVHGHWSYARNGNMINNFFYKNIICIGVLWWFMIYSGWSSTFVFDYTYLLFWNSFWTLCPVIAIGVFDRIVDDHILMAFPSLYRYGREGKWFGVKLFTVFMLEGVVQVVAIIFFILLYGYFSPSARNDGYRANLFNGLNTRFWTGWVFFSVFIGIILIFAFTVCHLFSYLPGWIVTRVYGLDHFLFRSPLFWFGLPITVLLSLLPRYLYMAWSFGFHPNDLDILNWNYKFRPNMDLIQEAYIHHEDKVLAATTVRPATRCSHIDMSTGVRSMSRGYGFAQEENGVAMRRMQSNLSGSLPLGPPGERKSRGTALLRSIRYPLRRKQPAAVGEPAGEPQENNRLAIPLSICAAL
ncbi:hypothetical protein BGW80DRAFT_1270175 [Lactifluus volemus]|nr:hypothetical protein BGW80DRAFT_1270175 [Lactifluus volemus]